MKPTIGRIVRYTLSAVDAEQINRRRTTGKAIADRIAEDKWPLGAQAHIGNTVNEGDSFPMLIVRVWSEESVNGRVVLDGTDDYWVTSVVPAVTAAPGHWNWPPRE